MSNHRIWRGVLLAVLGIGIAAAIGFGAYDAGVAHGLASGGTTLVEQSGAAHHAHDWGHGHGHGFFFAPFFFLIVLLFLARAPFWRRSWRGGCHPRDGIPPAFEEWHRRAHEQQTPGSGAR